MTHLSPPVVRGMIVGTCISVLTGMIYILVLREPGSAFYGFAALAFLVGPLVGGFVAASRTRERRGRAFRRSAAAVFGFAFVGFAIVYIVLPQFGRESVQLPAICNGFDGKLDSSANISKLPNGAPGLLLASDSQTDVVVTVDSTARPAKSTMFVVDKTNGRILRRMKYPNDVVSASLADGVVYVYNDKLGYLINARTGAFENSVLLIDNYGGLSESDRPFISRASTGRWFMETSAVISSWNADGTVRSRPYLVFNGIARGCYISGETRQITKL
jgi:hypothetical protein